MRTPARPSRPAATLAREESCAIVLHAVQVANIAYRRPVTRREIVAALTPRARVRLSSLATQPLDRHVGYILDRLIRRGNLFSAGKIARRAYYGHPQALPRSTPLPSGTRPVDETLAMVERLVREAGRAVSARDIIDAVLAGESIPAARTQPMRDRVGRHLHELVRDGRLQLLTDPRKSRGNGGGGRLYLPSALDPCEFAVRTPTNFADAVVAAFDLEWQRACREARQENRRPRPLTTGEIRARLRREWPDWEGPNMAVVLSGTLITLATRKRHPVLARTRLPGSRQWGWLPRSAAQLEGTVTVAYPNDSVRVQEALRRALARAGVLAVNQRAVVAEVERAPELALTGKISVAFVLSGLARDGDTPGRRRHPVVFRVGAVNNRPYYAADRRPETLAYAAAVRWAHEWDSARVDARVGAIGQAHIPSLALGRALVLQGELESLRRAAAQIQAEPTRHVESVMGARLQQLSRAEKQLASVVRQCRQRCEDAGVLAELPEYPDDHRPVLTLHEFHAIALPLWRVARRVRPSDLGGSVPRAIQRIPDERFEAPHHADPTRRTRMALERGSALLYLAAAWGGPFARTTVAQVRPELDSVRDPRFVVPALNNPSLEARLIAVGSLAFLGHLESVPLLRTAAIEDPQPGVRRAALWALGVLGAEGIEEFLAQRAAADDAPMVRSFVVEAQSRAAASKGGWWHV